MGDFAELGLEGMNYITDKYFDAVYDHLPRKEQILRRRHSNGPGWLRDRFGRLHRLNYQNPTQGQQNQGVAGAADGQNVRDRQVPDEARSQTKDRQAYDGGGGGDYGPDNNYPDARLSREGRPSNAYDKDAPPNTSDQYPPPNRSPTVYHHYPPELDPRAPSSENRRRRHSYSPSPSRSRSRNRSRERRGATIGANVLGAVAGGLAGSELTKGGTLGVVAGALVGALGAEAMVEKRFEKHGHREDRKHGRRDRGREHDNMSVPYDDSYDRRRNRHG